MGILVFEKKSKKIIKLLEFFLTGVTVSGCGIYEDVPLPVPAEESAVNPVEDSSPTVAKLAALSDNAGTIKYKVGIRGAPQPSFRAEVSSTGKANGAILLFNKDAFSKDFELIIEPAELPLAEMRAELGTTAKVQAVSGQIRIASQPLMDPGVTMNVGIPLANASSHPLVKNFAVLGLVTNVGEGGISEVVWIPQKELIIGQNRVSFKVTKFGIYGVVAVDPVIDAPRSISSKRLPAHYGASGLYRVTLTGLPKLKDPKSSSGGIGVSEETKMKATVFGPGIKDYKFELREDRSDCTDANYSSYLGVKKAITTKLGDNGLKTLCVVGKNAEGRETQVFQHTWIKQTPKSFVTIDGKNTLDFSDKKSKTVTLNVKGAKAKELKVSGLGNGFEFLGGKFPGTGGTCKKSGEDKSCTIVLNLKATTAGSYNAVMQVSYFDGTDKKTLNLTLKASL